MMVSGKNCSDIIIWESRNLGNGVCLEFKSSVIWGICWVEERIQHQWRVCVGHGESLVCHQGSWQGCVLKLKVIYMKSSQVYGSKSWGINEEQMGWFEQTEMRMLWWMCYFSLMDKVPIVKLRVRMATEAVKRNWFRWLRHVLWKDDGDWVKESMLYEVDHVKSKRPRIIWNQVVQKDTRCVWAE